MSTAYSTFMGPPDVGPIILPVSPLTTEQYLQIIDAGVFENSPRVELIGGYIIPMAPAGPDHSGSIVTFTRLFAAVLDRFELGPQITLRIAEGHVYDPDFMLLRLRADRYRRSLPTPEDVALLIESAFSSRRADRLVKLAVYAAASIEEYWIADLENSKLLVFRNPKGNRYLSEVVLAGDQTVTPLACPDLVIRVGDIFQ